MWLDTTHNVVIYNQKQDEILKSIPHAQQLVNGYVGFPVTLHNLQLARWIGLDVPPPLADYDWPGRFTPFKAQRVMANFMAVHPRCLNLSDMGTGKTLAALWAADYVMEENPGYKTLIVAPLSTLYRVWQDALFQHFLGRRKCVILHGSAAKRRELLNQNADFYIVNFDGVGVIRNELAARTDIKIIIIDEASAYRDATTKRHRVARAVLMGRDYLWLMTGTPTPNAPTDAYGLAKLVNNAFGESFMGYKFRCMIKVSMWKWMPKQGAHEMANALMQPSVRFSIDDCVDLPPNTVQLRDVELSPDQKEAYGKLRNHLTLMLKEGKRLTAANEAVLRLKLIQISCGAIYDQEHEIHHVDAAPRLSVLHEVMEQCSEKIIVFAPLTSVIKMLYRELSKTYECAVVNGEVSAKDRAEIFRSFQEDKSPRVLIADPGTMAHGLSLIAATSIIWYGPTDRTELYLQANKRISRPGQTKATTVVQLAATPIEREIYRRLERNETMQGLVLQLAKGVTDSGRNNDADDRTAD